MTVKRPTLEQIDRIASGFGFQLSAGQLAEYNTLLQNSFDAYDIVDELPDYIPAVRYPRESGYRPAADENRLGAWYYKTDIKGAPHGILSGKTVVLKDNVCLAGVPMMNGSRILEGYVPEVDATIVTRLLDAGATIVGKSVCEHYCFSAGSHTSATGPVHNPHRHGHTTGGSSSGSAALVAAGEVNMAIGGDQAGSIRMPSSFSGIYGMKPSFGLVPYTGIMPIELTIDHAGPMTATVEDNALMLEAIAGPDGLDPRQQAGRTGKRYSELMKRGVQGLRIGIVREGFEWDNSDPKVNEKVRSAAALFSKLGASVEEVSIPMHKYGPAIWLPIGAEGATQQMMKDGGHGFNWRGLYVTSLVERHSQWTERADELSHPLKLSMILGEYFISEYSGRYYAKAQNLARQLGAAYDSELEKFDLLLTPTMPVTATPIPDGDADIAEIVNRALGVLANTSPFNITSHPAMSIPCGMLDGLPVGLQLVGRPYEEETIYRAAYGFEQSFDWKRL